MSNDVCYTHVGRFPTEVDAHSFTVTFKHDGSAIDFVAGPNMRAALTDTLLTADGRTRGKHAEDELHAYLQEWIAKHKEP